MSLDEDLALSRAKAAYTQSTTYFDSSIRLQIENDLRQFNGQHPAGSKYYSDTYRLRSRIFRPKTRAAIRKSEAVAAEAYFATHDLINITPLDDTDDLGRAGADVLKALVQYRLTHSIPWFQVLMGAYQDALTVGVVASYQSWQYDEAKKIDRPAVKLLPVENLRFDPAAAWDDVIGTSPYVIELMPMYVKDVRGRMKPDPKTGEAKWKALTDEQLQSGMRNLADSTRLVREHGRTDSKDQPTEITDYSLVWVHRNIVAEDGVDWVYYSLGTEHLLSKPQRLDEVYWHGRRPYVLGYSVLETHKPYPGGVPRLTRDQQAEVNEIANQRLDNVKFAMNKRYFVKRNKQVDLRSLTRNVPGSVTLMNDPKEDVIIQDTPDVTSSAYAEQDRLNLDFDDLSGQFSQSSIASNRNLNETVGGMNLLATNGNQVGAYQLLTFTKTWVEPVLAQLVYLEQRYESDDSIIRIAGRAAQLPQKYGIDTVTDDILNRDMAVNVNVGMGATNPQAKVGNLMTAVNAAIAVAQSPLMGLGLKVNEFIQEIMGIVGYQDGGRFFSFDEADPQVQQLQQQIEQLQQALDAKHPPEVIAAQVEEIKARTQKLKDEATSKATETIYSATQAAQAIASVPQVAPLADTLLRSAGYTDRDQAPIVPALPAAAAVPPPATNTNPLTPANPAVGMNAGIETPENDMRSFAMGGYIDPAEDPRFKFQPVPENPIGMVSGMLGPRRIQRQFARNEMEIYKAGLANQQRGEAQRIAEEQPMPVLARPSLPGAPTPNVYGATTGAPTTGAGPLGNLQQATFGQPLGAGIFEVPEDKPKPPGFAYGGLIRKMATGGVVDGPGGGMTDSVPAVTDTGENIALSRGEMVLTPEQVQALGGPQVLDQIVQMLGGAQPQAVASGSYVLPAAVVQALQGMFSEVS